jgi:hypothetical protein
MIPFLLGGGLGWLLGAHPSWFWELLVCGGAGGLIAVVSGGVIDAIRNERKRP